MYKIAADYTVNTADNKIVRNGLDKFNDDKIGHVGKSSSVINGYKIKSLQKMKSFKDS